MEKTNNRTIAKNTAFLYFRMMFTMIVSLYTSRVILQTLGVDNYGICLLLIVRSAQVRLVF